MTTRFALTAAAAALCLTAGAAHAEDFQAKTKGTLMLNVRVTDVAPVAGNSIKTAAGAATGLKANVTSSVVPTIGLSYFLTDNWAVEVIAGASQHTVKAAGPTSTTSVRDTWVLPPVVALQYHFAPAAKVSPYVGAGINGMLFFNGKDRNGFNVHLQDGVGAALQGGVDVALQGRWSVNVDVKKVFFNTKAKINGGALTSSVNLDPLVASVGVGYKF